MESDQHKAELLEEIKIMAFRDPAKKELLEKFYKDKSCKWFTKVEKTAGERYEEAEGGIKGWCSKFSSYTP